MRTNSMSCEALRFRRCGKGLGLAMTPVEGSLMVIVV